MSDPETDDTTQAEENLGGLTIEDDPEGTIDPAELAGGAAEDDEDPVPNYSEDDLED